MRDFKKDSTLARFGRDKRARITESVSERVESGRHQRSEGASAEFKPQRKRVSYNPHFTEDNRPNFETTSRDKNSKPRFERSAASNQGSKFGKRGDSSRRSFGEKSYAEKSFGDKPSYGEKRERKFSTSDNRFAKRRQGGFKHDDKPKSYPKFDPNKQIGEIRLNRYVAQSGVCSRREADDFILAGLVSVNGVIVTELGTKVMPGDVVKFNDSKIEGEKKVYLVLNKPKGYVTSLEDPHADKTVMDLVKGACLERIYPVGRLDKNSLGLLLFTNDGDMTKQLTHPSYKKKKIYQVALDKPLTRADMEQIAEGIVLEDGEIHADEISYVKDNKTEVGIEIHSGRNRIVRRIFEYLGYTVQKLDRVYYAGLTKKNLKRGQWRFLTHDEVDRLKSGRYE